MHLVWLEAVSNVSQMDTYIDKCGLTKWIGAYSHFAYLLPLSAILPTHAKCDQNNVKQLKLQSLLHLGVIVLIWSARYNFILFGSHCFLASVSAFGTSPKNAAISSSSVDKILVSFVDKWACSSLGCDKLHDVADWNDWLR